MELTKEDFNSARIQMPGVATRKTTEPGFVSRAEEDQLQAEANQQGFLKTVSDAFSSGDNILYQTAGAIERKLLAGPADPEWGSSVDDWIKQNGIDPYDEWRYKATRNSTEADLLLSTERQNAETVARLERRGGFTTFVARGVAGLIDADAPLAVMTGGLSASAKLGYNATRTGRLLSGAAAGGLTMGAAGTLSHAVNPAEDWTVIPSMMLMGMGFGALGGSLGRTGADTLRKEGNAAVNEVKNDFGEYVDAGAPFQRKEDPATSPADPDPFGVQGASEGAGATAPREPAAFRVDPVYDNLTFDGFREVLGRIQEYTTGDRAKFLADAEQARTSRKTTATPGETVRVYHGSAADGTGDDISEMLWTSADKDHADAFARDSLEAGNRGSTPRTFEYELDTTNFLELDMAKVGELGTTVYTQLVLDAMRSGYSGVIIRGGIDRTRRTKETFDAVQYAVFDRSSLKGDEIPSYGPSSAGAAQVGTAPKLSDVPHGPSRKIIEKSKQFVVDNNLTQREDDFYMRTDAAGKFAAKFHQLLQRMPFASDFNRLMASDSDVLRAISYSLLDSASGLYKNNDSAARYFETYHNRALQHISEIPDKINAYITSKHGAGKLTAALRSDLQREVQRAVDAEMSARYNTGKSSADVDPIIKSIADDLDRWSAYMAEIESGRGGAQTAAKGSETLKAKSGWMHTRWGPQAYRDMIKSGRTPAEIVQALAEGIRRQHPKMKSADISIYAAAIADRMRLGTINSGTSIQSWLNMDGREAVEAFLARQGGISQERARQIIDAMTGTRETASTPGYTRSRLDIDRTFVASNGIRMGDLMEGDFYGLAVRRSHQGAGRAALARKGITSRADFESIAKAAVYEQEYLIAPGKTTRAPTGNASMDSAQKMADAVSDWWHNPKAVSYEDIMEMYNYFNGTPVRGGTSPIVSMMKKVSNLTTLGQLGFASGAELGTVTATMGTKKFMQDLPQYIKDSIGNKESGMYQDLRALGVYTPDDRLHRFDQVYSTESLASDASALARFNHMLNVGGRVQGFLSGFIHTSRVHHAMSVDAGVNKLFQHYAGTKTMSDRRVRDMLGDNNTLGPKLEQYIKNGVVEFEDGYVKHLNLDKWAVDDVDALARALNAYSHTLMQRPLIGEASMATAGDLGALFWHLKTFPLVAMEKQVIRNANIADMESLYTFFHTLGTAALMYTVKQGINLNTDNLDPYSIATGALQMSNMAGWVPMWTDPIGGLLGMDTGYGRSTSILAMPVAMTTLDRLARVPGVFLKDELSPSDVTTLQSIPIVGRLIGVTAIANTWKDQIADQRAAQRRAEREAQKQPEQDTGGQSQDVINTEVFQQLGLN